MGYWLTSIAIPGIVASFLIIGCGLLLAYLAIRSYLAVAAPAKTHLTSRYFEYFWMASVFAIAGYLIAEFGYQLNFWEAPGIWGAPGRESTIWASLAYVLPCLGFPVGFILNWIVAHKFNAWAHGIRVGVSILAAVLLIVTLMLSAWNGMQTLG